jgi:hypothetical protein
MTTQLAPEPPLPSSAPDGFPAQKQELLLAFYRTAWEEATWRRNAGYRTIILGFGYLAALLAVVAFNHAMTPQVHVCLAAVVAIATVFGGAYLVSNYGKYMAALRRMVQIEDPVGAFDADFLGPLGPLMPATRRSAPDRPITRDMICLWSVIAFVLGGLLTALAILVM